MHNLIVVIYCERLLRRAAKRGIRTAGLEMDWFSRQFVKNDLASFLSASEEYVKSTTGQDVEFIGSTGSKNILGFQYCFHFDLRVLGIEFESDPVHP